MNTNKESNLNILKTTKINIINEQIKLYTSQLEEYDRHSSNLSMSTIAFFGVLLTVIGGLMRFSDSNASSMLYITLLIIVLLVPCLITLFLYQFSMNCGRVAVYRGYLCFLENRLNQEMEGNDVEYNNNIDKVVFAKFLPNRFGPIAMTLFLIIMLSVSWKTGKSILRSLDYQIPLTVLFIAVFVISILCDILYVICLSNNGKLRSKTTAECWNFYYNTPYSENHSIVEEVKRPKRDMVKSIIKWICGIIFGCYVFISAFIFLYCHYIVFGRNELQPDNLELQYNSLDQALYSRRAFSFNSKGNVLYGYIYGEENREQGVIIIAHGINSGADSHLAETIYFVDAGWCVISFDGTGTRASGGNRIRGLAQTKIDIIAIVNSVKEMEEFEECDIFLFGHSMGGYAVLSSLTEIGDYIKGVVCISGFDSPTETMRQMIKKESKLFAAIETPILSLYNFLTFKENANTRAVDGINASDIPILIVYGNLDDVIPPEEIGVHAYEKDIKNDNVRFLEITEMYRNRHETIWYSRQAAEKRIDLVEQLDKLHAQYGSIIPESILENVFTNIDMNELNEVDIDFMNTINEFYQLAGNQ